MPHPNTTVHPSRGPHNSLWYVNQDVRLTRMVWNTFWIVLSRWSTLRVKNWMLRRTGAKIGKHASIGFEATLDIIYPQDVTIGENVVIGYNSTILCHGYIRHEYQRGPVVIEDDASIGAGSMILPGVTVGKGAVVGAMSLVRTDIPAGEFWAGVPARKIRDAY